MDIVIFGTSLFAEIAYYYLMKDSPYKVVAFTADKEFIDRDELFGIPIVPFEDIEEHYPPNDFKMFIAVGYNNLNKTRAKKYHEAKEKGYQLISYVCSKAIVWDDLQIGDNCFIFEANVIQPYVKIGNDVIIWSGNHIGHHSIINDHSFISSHVVISGSCKIGSYTFIGVNSSLKEGISINGECMIGAGSLILTDIEEQGIYVGSPARLVRKIY